MDLDWPSVVSRWLHILAAITAVGGAVFMRFALLPGAAGLDDAQRQQLIEGVRSRWAKFVMAAIGLLLLSGFYNFFTIIGAAEPPAKPYHMLFGIKFLLALAIFYLASVLVGRSAMAQKFRQNATLWLNVNLTLAVVLVCLSGILKNIPREPKPDSPPAQSESVAPSARDRA